MSPAAGPSALVAFLQDMADEYDTAKDAADMLARGMEVETNVRPEVLQWAIRQRAQRALGSNVVPMPQRPQ